MPAMNQYIEAAASPEVRVHLRQQWDDAVHLRRIRCACGQLRALELAFRCLYCGAWFCVPCAELHFGETILGRRQRIRSAMRAERVDSINR